jgi:hypothetical protein
MKALFNHLKSRINTAIPIIKTVRMFNNQMVHGNDIEKKDEKFFPTPACFIEFIENDVYNRCLGIKDVQLTIRFRFSRVSYKFERLETFDFVDNFDSFIQLLAPTTASGLVFSTLQEIATEWDEDHNNVENPYRDYRTLYRRTSGYKLGTNVISPPINPIVSGQVKKYTDIPLT